MPALYSECSRRANLDGWRIRSAARIVCSCTLHCCMAALDHRETTTTTATRRRKTVCVRRPRRRKNSATMQARGIEQARGSIARSYRPSDVARSQACSGSGGRLLSSPRQRTASSRQIRSAPVLSWLGPIQSSALVARQCANAAAQKQQQQQQQHQQLPASIGSKRRLRIGGRFKWFGATGARSANASGSDERAFG